MERYWIDEIRSKGTRFYYIVDGDQYIRCFVNEPEDAYIYCKWLNEAEQKALQQYLISFDGEGV